jgi:hypothetical protein
MEDKENGAVSQENGLPSQKNGLVLRKTGLRVLNALEAGQVGSGLVTASGRTEVTWQNCVSGVCCP